MNEGKDTESLNQGSSHGAKKERLLVFVLLQNSNVDGEWQIDLLTYLVLPAISIGQINGDSLIFKVPWR